MSDPDASHKPLPHDAQLQLTLMRKALDQAKLSPPKPTNFCVGAVLLNQPPPRTSPFSQQTWMGHTLELPGNTHAEQVCFMKAAEFYECPVEELGLHLPEHTVLYTTMEPCNKRSVGNTPCVDRILALQRADGKCAIDKVFVGLLEPETFVGVNEGRASLEQAGVEVVRVEGLEREIEEVAKAGHVKEGAASG